MEKRKLLNKIHKEFPELKWKVAEHNVKGWNHYIIILDNKYIFRFPRTDEYTKELKNEILLLEYLNNKVGINIPRYIYIAKDKSFAGYLSVSGEQLKKKVFKKLSNKTKSLIAKQLADFLSSLHKTSNKITKQYKVKDINSKTLYKKLVSNINKYIISRISKKDQIIINDYLKEFKKYLVFPNKVLTHNDLYSSHILLNKNKKSISGIIDFSDRRVDDPARDFTELWDYGEKFVLEVYKNYKGPKDDDFLKRSIMYYKRIPIHHMIARFTDNMGGFKKGYKMFKARFSTFSK
jgi:aminoglycoside 2''-phosphotransferase